MPDALNVCAHCGARIVNLVDLTPVDIETLRLLLEGKSDQEIADKCCVERTTVKHRMQKLYGVFGMRHFEGHKRIKLAMIVDQQQDQLHLRRKP